MNLTKEGFKAFASTAFPDVDPSSNQFKIMEVIWNSAIFWSISTAYSAPRGQENDVIDNFLKESRQFCDDHCKGEFNDKLN